MIWCVVFIIANVFIVFFMNSESILIYDYTYCSLIDFTAREKLGGLVSVGASVCSLLVVVFLLC